MRKLNNKGFSLVELIVVMAIFIVVMLMIGNSFDTIVGRSSQQVKSATTDTEGVVGLELLRSDLERAGFGLPWSFSVTPPQAFVETSANHVTGIDSSSFNEITPSALRYAFAPAGAKILDGSSNTNPGTAYLVIKATNVAQNDTGKKWSYVTYQQTVAGVNTSYVAAPMAAGDNFLAGDRVITLSSSFDTSGNPTKTLAMDSSATDPSTSIAKFFYALSGVPSNVSGSQVQPYSDKFMPADGSQLYMVYGVDPSNDLRMPYNRADYYVKKASPMPTSCNPGTGVLYKTIMQQGSDASAYTEYPLLTCVGDMQVEFELTDPVNPTGVRFSPTLTASDGVTLLTPDQIRAQLLNIHVYILSHEGKKDRNFTYTGDSVQVGDSSRPASSGRTLDSTAMTNLFGADWKNYRWKVRTIVVHPKNLD